MRLVQLAVILIVLISSLTSCRPLNNDVDRMKITQRYSLCPKTQDATQILRDQIWLFADNQKAQLIDRGDGAQQELSEMGSGVLKNTGARIILLTVEKPDEFRISLTNLGLEEKIALVIRTQEVIADSPINDLMGDLASSWVIEKVDRSVTNDPPCRSII